MKITEITNNTGSTSSERANLAPVNLHIGSVGSDMQEVATEFNNPFMQMSNYEWQIAGHIFNLLENNDTPQYDSLGYKITYRSRSYNTSDEKHMLKESLEGSMAVKKFAILLKNTDYFTAYKTCEQSLRENVEILVHSEFDQSFPNIVQELIADYIVLRLENMFPSQEATTSFSCKPENLYAVVSEGSNDYAAALAAIETEYLEYSSLSVQCTRNLTADHAVMTGLEDIQ